jgi:hypothetical protein
MRYTLVTELEDFLDGDGKLEDQPAPGINLALFLGSIVAWVTRLHSTTPDRTNVLCHRKPGNKRCLGEIVAVLDEIDCSISWKCPLCGDNGIIRGWKDTPWDRGVECI